MSLLLKSTPTGNRKKQSRPRKRRALSAAQGQLLRLIAETPEMSLAELTRQAGYAKPDKAELALQGLVGLGLVTWRPGALPRTLFYSITYKGTVALRDIAQA